MTRLAKPEKKAGKGNERREIYAKAQIKANSDKGQSTRGIQRIPQRLERPPLRIQPRPNVASGQPFAPGTSNEVSSVSEVTE